MRINVLFIHYTTAQQSILYLEFLISLSKTIIYTQALESVNVKAVSYILGFLALYYIIKRVQ